MSSGNPFRASLFPNNAPSSPVAQVSLSISDSTPEASEDSHFVLEDAVSLPARTKKHVRIEPSTRAIPQHPNADKPDGSLYGPLTPPPSAGQCASALLPVRSAGLSDSDANADLYPAETGRGYGAAAQDVWAHSKTTPEAPQTTPQLVGVPANPFSRTLATIDPHKRGDAAERTAAERTTQINSRASLDVESFKNLLLTGRPSPRPSGQSPQATTTSNNAGAPIFESSSSTDTSSISRQSLFDHAHEAHAESPRTSYEMAASDEDERAGLVLEVKKEKKKPPPAPKPRHGKPVAPRQPQTVPFDDFTVNMPVPAPVSRQNSSDINRALPPTPVVSPSPLQISTQDSTKHSSAPVQPRMSETPSTSDVLHSQKRVPPPVPLARRQSQLRSSTTNNRSRSSSSVTTSSQISTNAVAPSPTRNSTDPMPSIRSPPPPPPHRRGARIASIETSSANSSTTELPQRSKSVRTPASSRGPSLTRRSTLDSEPSSSVPGINRTSSVSSTRKTQRTVSGESTGSLIQSPPPPPPPRRRRSNRSSLDQQRPYVPSSSTTESNQTSVENGRTSLDSQRRTSATSEGSLKREYAPADEKSIGSEYALYSPREESENVLDSGAHLEEGRKDSSNILDDMEKFQREIDELRARYTKAA